MSSLNGWQYNKYIYIENKAHENLSGEVFEVVLDSDFEDFWDYVNSDGSDLRFTTENDVLLQYFIYVFDKNNKHARVFIKIPALSDTNFQADYFPVKVYYGNPDATSQSDESIFVGKYDVVGTTTVDLSGIINGRSLGVIFKLYNTYDGGKYACDVGFLDAADNGVFMGLYDYRDNSKAVVKYGDVTSGAFQTAESYDFGEYLKNHNFIGKAVISDNNLYIEAYRDSKLYARVNYSHGLTLSDIVKVRAVLTLATTTLYVWYYKNNRVIIPEKEVAKYSFDVVIDGYKIPVDDTSPKTLYLELEIDDTYTGFWKYVNSDASNIKFDWSNALYSSVGSYYVDTFDPVDKYAKFIVKIQFTPAYANYTWPGTVTMTVGTFTVGNKQTGVIPSPTPGVYLSEPLKEYPYVWYSNRWKDRFILKVNYTGSSVVEEPVIDVEIQRTGKFPYFEAVGNGYGHFLVAGKDSLTPFDTEVLEFGCNPNDQTCNDDKGYVKLRFRPEYLKPGENVFYVYYGGNPPLVYKNILPNAGISFSSSTIRHDYDRRAEFYREITFVNESDEVKEFWYPVSVSNNTNLACDYNYYTYSGNYFVADADGNPVEFAEKIMDYDTLTLYYVDRPAFIHVVLNPNEKKTIYVYTAIHHFIARVGTYNNGYALDLIDVADQVYKCFKYFDSNGVNYVCGDCSQDGEFCTSDYGLTMNAEDGIIDVYAHPVYRYQDNRDLVFKFINNDGDEFYVRHYITGSPANGINHYVVDSRSQFSSENYNVYGHNSNWFSWFTDKLYSFDVRGGNIKMFVNGELYTTFLFEKDEFNQFEFLVTHTTTHEPHVGFIGIRDKLPDDVMVMKSHLLPTGAIAVEAIYETSEGYTFRTTPAFVRYSFPYYVSSIIDAISGSTCVSFTKDYYPVYVTRMNKGFNGTWLGLGEGSPYTQQNIIVENQALTNKVSIDYSKYFPEYLYFIEVDGIPVAPSDSVKRRIRYRVPNPSRDKYVVVVVKNIKPTETVVFRHYGGFGKTLKSYMVFEDPDFSYKVYIVESPPRVRNGDYNIIYADIVDGVDELKKYSDILRFAVASFDSSELDSEYKFGGFINGAIDLNGEFYRTYGNLVVTPGSKIEFDVPPSSMGYFEIFLEFRVPNPVDGDLIKITAYDSDNNKAIVEELTYSSYGWGDRITNFGYYGMTFNGYKVGELKTYSKMRIVFDSKFKIYINGYSAELTSYTFDKWFKKVVVEFDTNNEVYIREIRQTPVIVTAEFDGYEYIKDSRNYPVEYLSPTDVFINVSRMFPFTFNLYDGG